MWYGVPSHYKMFEYPLQNCPLLYHTMFTFIALPFNWPNNAQSEIFQNLLTVFVTFSSKIIPTSLSCLFLIYDSVLSGINSACIVHLISLIPKTLILILIISFIIFSNFLVQYNVLTLHIASLNLFCQQFLYDNQASTATHEIP